MVKSSLLNLDFVIGFNSFESRNIKVKNRYKDTFSKEQRKDNMTIYQPELRTHLIYGFGYEKIVDGIISNKFIQRVSK